jgi:ADP-ribose pyrophosphatase YjhB (NUDIX family)
MELEIHPVQADILLVLLFKPVARFIDLNTTGMTTDHFTFHVKRLVKLGLIRKNKKNNYLLTPRGKEFANRFDTDSVIVERQAKLGVLVICVKEVRGVLHLLVQKRLKQPYFGYYGFISGKIRWGEELSVAASRELKEEAGLSGDLELVGIEHKIDYSKDGKLLEDKFFYIFRVTNTKGKLINEFVGGKNEWLLEKEIRKLPNLFGDMLELIDVVKGKKFVFFEKKFKVKSY